MLTIICQKSYDLNNENCDSVFSERSAILKNILKRGTVLLLAMVMIMTCGAFNMTFAADDGPKTLTIKVIDQNGDPVPNIQLQFEHGPKFSANENGIATYTITDDSLYTQMDYSIEPVDTKAYKCSDPLTARLEDDDDPYFAYVNDEEYTGETVTLNVVKQNAEKTYNISVTGGTATVNGKAVTKAAESTVVSLTAADKEGHAFKNWSVTSGSVTFTDANAKKTTFTMPASDVSIKAVYEAKKIKGLTAESARDEYLEGETFKLKGNAIIEYDDQTTKKLNSPDITISPSGPLTSDVTEVTVSYNKNPEIKAIVPVKVKKKVDWPVMNDLPANQPKDIWETATENIPWIDVSCGDDMVPDLNFVFYDVTTQDPDDKITVTTDSNGFIKDLKLKRDHNYLIYCDSDEYFMQNKYVWVHDGQLRNIKDVYPDPQDETKPVYNYAPINNLTVVKSTQSTTSNYSRYTTAIPVEYNGKAMSGIKFRLVSPVETLEATTDENGILKADLLEDVNYMVSVESDKYAVEAFPLAVKDKSEYRMGKYAYDHSDCQGVGPRYNGVITPIQLVDKGTERENDKTITSVSGDTTISGMNFKDLYCVEKKMDTKVSGLSDGTYDVYDIEAMNPHRSEVSKLAAGDFTVTEKTRAGVKVKAVYMLSSDGKLKALSFKQTKAGDPVTFKADSIGVNNVVIQYYDSLGKYTDVMGHGAVWNKGGKTPYIAKFENTDPTKNDETIDNFIGISIDGKDLVRDKDYVAKAGSVITEIRPEYMETLGAGSHTLTAYFMDGDPVSVNFTVKAAAAEGAGTGAGHSLTGTTVTKVSVVKTGDSFSWTPVFMFMAAVIALAVVVVFEKRRKQQR